MLKKPILFLIALSVPATASNSPLRYHVESTQSEAVAKVAFFGLASKTARFPSISGDVSFAPGNLRNIRVNVAIDARRLKAGDGVTQRRLKSKDFFWVEKYPTVRFKSSSLAMRNGKAGKLSGNLTARGVTRPVTMNVVFSKAPGQAKGGERFTMTGKAVINRRDFGMTAYSAIVGKKVNITIKAGLAGR